jgi:serine protease AprX
LGIGRKLQYNATGSTMRNPKQLTALRSPRTALAPLVLALLAAVAVATTGGSARPTAATADVSVIVRAQPGAGVATEALVRRLGGRVEHGLPLVSGFAAHVPARALAPLRAARGVLGVTPNAAVHFASIAASASAAASSSLVLPSSRWRKALNDDPTVDGSGVTVALIDTGVAPVAELIGQVVAAVDFTPEGDGIDRYGHGTHIAGLIAANGASTRGLITGVAPGAKLVSVKVAGGDGATDVSAVIAGIQWVIVNQTKYGIRVLNLSFGTDSTAPYGADPLDYAVEQAWKAGIVVVVSAGNRGPNPGTIDKPGDDPYVITVGAAYGPDDRTVVNVADFSGRGPTQDGFAKPDFLAPGVSVMSVRAPDSYADISFPSARLGSTLFKGTGTSQSTAEVSGVAALLLGAAPTLTPDQVKADLAATAGRGLVGAPGAGAGIVDGGAALALALSGKSVPPANQGLTPSTGTGSLDASRGSIRVTGPTGKPVTGEVSVTGKPFVAKTWSGTVTAKTWSDNGWVAKTWSGAEWAAKTWSSNGWVAKTWSGVAWSIGKWSNRSWNSLARP